MVGAHHFRHGPHGPAYGFAGADKRETTGTSPTTRNSNDDDNNNNNNNNGGGGLPVPSLPQLQKASRLSDQSGSHSVHNAKVTQLE
ncbi:hypothetical protein PG994_010406 [Apiospora phragmitis]|uniref:Uncharacterized protein n=1 Tax=Apiospora phragmitis TaxID=2905665 RepID=A0ABR1TPV6_9PEZI